MSADLAKYNAALAALDFVKDGMVLGLGTGSTSAHFVRLLGERVRQGLRVKGVPTSEATRTLAEQVGVPLVEISQVTAIDVDVDGADEIDPAFRLIKGGGGALLREKIVASASARMIVIADATKKVAKLGAFPLPVEIVRFGCIATRNMVEVLAAESGCRGTIRRRLGKNGEPFLTDGGNYILDCAFGRIDDPDLLEQTLKLVPGVVESGLFIGLADVAIIAASDGIEILETRPDED